MTEKNYNPEQKNNKTISKQQKAQKIQQQTAAKTEKLEKKRRNKD